MMAAILQNQNNLRIDGVLDMPLLTRADGPMVEAIQAIKSNFGAKTLLVFEGTDKRALKLLVF